MAKVTLFRVLRVKNNDIMRLDGLDKLPQLRELDASGNKLNPERGQLK